MRLKCTGVINDYKDSFLKGSVYEATEIKNGICYVSGDRDKANGTLWAGVFSLGGVVVLGVAKFDILKEDGDGKTI